MICELTTSRYEHHGWAEPFFGTIDVHWVTTSQVKMDWASGRVVDMTVHLADGDGGRTWWGRKRPPVKRTLPLPPLTWVPYSRQAVYVR